jgi:hypothetical protein
VKELSGIKGQGGDARKAEVTALESAKKAIGACVAANREEMLKVFAE